MVMLLWIFIQTERDFKEIYQSKHLLHLRTVKIMWLMIDAICNGYLEFRAMIYGVNPGRYWIDILTMAHGWAIDCCNCQGRFAGVSSVNG